MPTQHNGTEHLNTDESAKLLGVSRQTFLKMIKSRNLKGIALEGYGSSRFFPKEVINNLNRVASDPSERHSRSEESRVLSPQFVQVGAFFVNISDILYVDFNDERGCKMILKSPASSEVLQFTEGTEEYNALLVWLVQRTEIA